MPNDLGASPYEFGFFVGRSTITGDKEILVARSDTHYLALWFGLVAESGRWEIIAADFLPRAGAAERDVHAWLDAMSPFVERAIENGAKPLNQGDVRGVPLRAAASMRARLLLESALQGAQTVPTEVRSPDAPGLTPRQRQMAGILQDALDYGHARRYGVSPAALIAARRNIAPGSAEQRIVKARIAGFLSEAESNRVAGGATEVALQFQRELYAALGYRILGKA
jgi:hypothetical protein